MTDIEAKRMAEHTTIIRAVVGSTAHGLNLEGSDDRDEMGICVEPIEQFVGFNEFEQFIYRSAAEREGKHDAPSQAGDLDLCIYGLRKFLRLALAGNPSVMLLLFVQPKDCVSIWAPGMKLQDLAPQIVSRQCGKRYLGYMESQRQRLLGERGQKKVNRPELEEKYGFDTKYAMHVLRLGFQGVELLRTGRITLPMEAVSRDFLLDVRQGGVSLQHVLTTAGELERDLKDLLTTSPLAEHPNTAFVEDWMIHLYSEMWKVYAANPTSTLIH